MKLTVLDLRKQEFKRTMRGYDPDEVRTFLDSVSREWDLLNTENKELQTRCSELETQIRDFRQMESVIRQTMKAAEDTNRQQVEMARQQASVILRDAEIKAAQAHEDARREVQILKTDLQVLTASRTDLMNRMVAMVDAFKRTLDEMNAQFTPTAVTPMPEAIKTDPPTDTQTRRQVPEQVLPTPDSRQQKLDRILNTLD